MARAVRIDDLYRFILPGAPALSPDGRLVAYTIKRLNRGENRYESHLWLSPLAGGRARRLTHGLVLDSGPAWSPDGKTLAFVSDRGDKPNVWLLPLDGGEPRRLTDFGGGPISALAWAPDGREIAFEHFSVPKIPPDEKKRRPASKHITRLFHKEDGFGYFADEYWTVWKANAKSGRTTALTAGPHHDRSPRWSPDGKKIVFSSVRGVNADRYPDLASILVMDRGGKGVRDITPEQGIHEHPRWSRDGKFVYWVGFPGGPGEWLQHEHSVWRTPANGAGPSLALNLGHDRWVMNMVGSDTTASMGALIDVYQDGDSERVVFGSDEDGSYRLYSVRADGGDLRREFEGNVSVLGLSVGRGSLPVAACVASTTHDTGELYRVPLDGSRSPKQLSKHTAPFFRPLKFREPEEVRVKNGTTDLQAWVLKPPQFREGKKYPCLIEVHGGPMTQYGQAWFHEMQVLAAQGWVVAYCNPRGSSGRGLKFCNVIDGRWGTDDWSDVQALTNWAAKRPYVDASRLGILGGSYGGFVTTWAVAHTNRYKAAVTQRQAGDWHIMFGASDFGFYDIYSLKCFPWEDPMAYHRASPNFYVKGIRTPLLIVHSEEDYRCPIAQGDALFTAMKVLDQAPCELIRFEGESHGLSRGGRPRNREERLKRIVGWFERYL